MADLMMAATLQDDVGLMAVLMEHDPDLTDMTDEYGFSPLCAAALMGKTLAASFLVECGADVHFQVSSLELMAEDRHRYRSFFYHDVL